MRPANALARDRRTLANALDLLADELGTNRPDVCGQRLCEVWAWNLVAPVARAVTAGSPPPDLDAGSVRARLHEAPVDVRFEFRANGALPADPGQVTAALAKQLCPLIETVRALSRRPRSALWRGAGDRVAQAFLYAGEERGEPERGLELAREALAPPGPLAGPVRVREVEVDGGVGRLPLRNGCCLWHRIPGEPKCEGCPLLAHERRAAGDDASG